MNSILLGSLAFSGINEEKHNNKKNNNLNSVYWSDMENTMNQIELNQAKQNFSAPEYLRQFDDLIIDNISQPVGVNDSHMTTSGVNTCLQRNLDFANGYSNFQQSDMHYDVVSRDNFTHNNMVPNTSRRDFDPNVDRTQRKLETFTGVFDNYTAKKEKVPLFEPMADLTWVNGMPAVASKLQNRYLPSNKNNYGNLPFENQLNVRPGIGDENQYGNYAVYRILPRNIDALRSDINQKVTYENKPLETIKKGDFRAPDPSLTKYKLPDFREQSFDDLVASRGMVEAQKKTGEYTNMDTQRNEQQFYQPGPGINTTRGDGPDRNKTKFEAAKRETYYNDPTHAVSGVNNKPVMTNAKSYFNYENQRATTNIQYEAPVSNAMGGGINYSIDYKDVPLTTMRELMIHGDNNIGVVGGQDKGNYIFSNDMVLPVTQRQTMEAKPIINAQPVGGNGYAEITDSAKPTIKQSTSHSLAINPQPIGGNGYTEQTDQAKTTIRQGTSHSLAINAQPIGGNGYTEQTDKAKTTIRQGTSHSLAINAQPIGGNGYAEQTDQAKTTIRQGTSHSLAINAQPTGGNGYTEQTDKAKTTIRQGTSHNFVINAQPMGTNGYAEQTDKAKTTIRQGTSHSLVINVQPTGGNGYAEQTDKAKQTIRQSTSHNLAINAQPTGGNGYAEQTDKAKTTIRQSTSHNLAINAQPTGGNGYAEQTDIAKPTIRQSTLISSRPAGNPNYANQNYTRDVNDKARTTIRESTEQTQHIGHANSNINEATYVRDLEDKAKPTIRQTTEQTQHINHANYVYGDVGYVKDLEDKARPTIKQTTLHNTPGGRLNNTNMGNYIKDLEDKARPTIKQTTLLEDYRGGAHGEIDGQISHIASNNMTIDDRREQTTYNRAPNGKGDLNGPYIDRDNVRMNDRRDLFTYVPAPHKSLDFSVTPIVSRETIEKVYAKSKPVIETSSYYVNPNFINTLKNNPLVNDIYHQKNV